MTAATTLPPAYYAPLTSSRRASGLSSDQETWLDETLEGTVVSDWRNQYNAALSYAHRPATFDDSRISSLSAYGETSDRDSLSEALRQVYALQSLREGWNGSDALPPAESVRHARLWLEAQWQQCQTEGVRWYAPNVTADAEGNVVFEWWAEDRTLSFTFVEDAEDGSKDRAAEYLKFGRRDGMLAGLREQGTADTAEEAATLMRWFGE